MVSQTDKIIFVAVVDQNQQPLMPTTPARARKWIKTGKATPFFKTGIFCVRLNVSPSERNTQKIAVGIDPGSKKEGYTVKSNAHTYLNIQCDTPTWTSEKIKTGFDKGKNCTTIRRRNARRNRRQRKTPYRKCRNLINKNHQRMPATTRARWSLKLNICLRLIKLFPVTDFVVEDIKAPTQKKCKQWNQSFSPLQVGKDWFYYQLNRIAPVTIRQGYETFKLREELRLNKNQNKLAEKFDAHCVDSWVLAFSLVGGCQAPDNTNMLLITPHNFSRRQLHLFNFQKGGTRKRYGGTICASISSTKKIKKGALVKHKQFGVCYVSGYRSNPTLKDPARITLSLYSLSTGKRLTQNALIEDCKVLTNTSARIRYVPSPTI